MTDRELLEKAARAAGIDLVHSYYIPTDGAVLTAAGYGMRPWNPLTDDGDALRLAVKLRLDCLFDSVDSLNAHIEVVANLPWDGRFVGQPWAAEPMRTDDPYAATRRAIVRAAAQMGE